MAEVSDHDGTVGLSDFKLLSDCVDLIIYAMVALVLQIAHIYVIFGELYSSPVITAQIDVRQHYNNMTMFIVIASHTFMTLCPTVFVL